MNQLRGSVRLKSGEEIAKHRRRILGIAPSFASRSLDHSFPRWRPAPCPRGRRFSRLAVDGIRASAGGWHWWFNPERQHPSKE